MDTPKVWVYLRSYLPKNSKIIDVNVVNRMYEVTYSKDGVTYSTKVKVKGGFSKPRALYPIGQATTFK